MPSLDRRITLFMVLGCTPARSTMSPCGPIMQPSTAIGPRLAPSRRVTSYSTMANMRCRPRGRTSQPRDFLRPYYTGLRAYMYVWRAYGAIRGYRLDTGTPLFKRWHLYINLVFLCLSKKEKPTQSADASMPATMFTGHLCMQCNANG